MENKEKIKKWPDDPGYFTKTNVQRMVDQLPHNARILGLPCDIKKRKAMAIIIKHPGMVSKDDISKD